MPQGRSRRGRHNTEVGIIMLVPTLGTITICATHSRFGHCSAGIGPERTLMPACRCCRPISGIETRGGRTGICRPRRSCWPWPHGGWTRPGRRASDEPHRPDPASVLHRQTRQAAASQPAHRRVLPRLAQAVARVRPEPHRQDPYSPGLGRPRRRPGRGVPRPPRTRPAQQPAHPQPAADRHPLAVHLRRAASPRARRGDPTGLGGPGQTIRQTAHHVSHRRRDRRPCRRTRCRSLGRPQRPRTAAVSGPDRATRVGTDRT